MLTKSRIWCTPAVLVCMTLDKQLKERYVRVRWDWMSCQWLKVTDSIVTHPPQSLRHEENKRTLSPPNVNANSKNQMGNYHTLLLREYGQKQNENWTFHANPKNIWHITERHLGVERINKRLQIGGVWDCFHRKTALIIKVVIWIDMLMKRESRLDECERNSVNKRTKEVVFQPRKLFCEAKCEK